MNLRDVFGESLKHRVLLAALPHIPTSQLGRFQQRMRSADQSVLEQLDCGPDDGFAIAMVRKDVGVDGGERREPERVDVVHLGPAGRSHGSVVRFDGLTDLFAGRTDG